MNTRDRGFDVKKELEKIIQNYDYESYRENDPVEFIWRLSKSKNQEIIGLIASSLSYGRIEVFKKAIEEVFQILSPSPSLSIKNSLEEVESPLEGFSYRMTKSEDLIDLLYGIRSCVEEYGSLEETYKEGKGSHLEKCSSFVQKIRQGRKRDPLERGFKYLLSNPENGSACKRLHLFFRWMVRGPNQIDIGIWDCIQSSELIIPLDTHIHKISRKLGLTDRKSKNIKTAKEITENLKNWEKEDPLKYDFPLCHIGVKGEEEKLDFE